MEKQELHNIAKRTEEMLLNIGSLEDDEGYEDIYEFLSEGVLSIERTQNLVNDGWKTTEYSLCTGFGGPNVDVYTSGHIRVAWWSEPYYYTVSPEAKDILTECEECLDDIYGESD